MRRIMLVWTAYRPMKFIAFIVKIVNKFYNSILSHHVQLHYNSEEYHLLTSSTVIHYITSQAF